MVSLPPSKVISCAAARDLACTTSWARLTAPFLTRARSGEPRPDPGAGQDDVVVAVVGVRQQQVCLVEQVVDLVVGGVPVVGLIVVDVGRADPEGVTPRNQEEGAPTSPRAPGRRAPKPGARCGEGA